MPDRTTYKYGYCQLLASPELAAGHPAAYGDFSALTVPLASGFVLAGQPAAGQPAGAGAAPLIQAASGTGSAGRKLFQA
jgi:hypothetical protein